MDPTQRRLYQRQLQQYQDELLALLAPRHKDKNLLQHEQDKVAYALEHGLRITGVGHELERIAQFICSLDAVLRGLEG